MSGYCHEISIFQSVIIKHIVLYGCLDVWLLYEPQHDKTNKMTSAQFDQSLLCAHEETLGP